MNDCPPLLAPQVLNCSGRGICISNQCACESGWTGLGDFIVGSPFCDINITAIQFLWGLAALVHLLSIPFSLYVLNLNARRKVSKARRRFLTLIAAVIWTHVFVSASSIIRATHFERTIGTDGTLTVLFVLGAAGFWTFACLASRIFLGLLHGQVKAKSKEEVAHLARVLRFMNYYLPFLWLLCLSSCTVVLFMLINTTNSTTMYALAAAHYCGLALSMGMFLLCSFWIMSPVLRDLKFSIQSSQSNGTGNSANIKTLTMIRSKFLWFHSQVRDQCTVQIATAAMFGLWPFVQRYASYQLPLAWMFTAPIMVIGLRTVVPMKKVSAIDGAIGATPDSKGTTSQDKVVGGGAAAITPIISSQNRNSSALSSPPVM